MSCVEELELEPGKTTRRCITVGPTPVRDLSLSLPAVRGAELGSLTLLPTRARRPDPAAEWASRADAFKDATTRF